MNKLAKVLIIDQFPDAEIEARELDQVAEVRSMSPQADRADLLTAAQDADALLLGLVQIDADFIARLTRCRILARYGVGVESIDLAAARKAGIVVTNVPDATSEEVSIHAIALALALARQLPTSSALVLEGKWGLSGIGPLTRISESRFGVIGLGRIGSRVARMAQALGFQVTGFDPISEIPAGVLPLSQKELLATCDIVSLHVPLITSTHHLISADQLAVMKASAILINTARGGLVDTPALVAALKDGKLGAAGLDTLEDEPPSPGEFADIPNLLITGHIGFYSRSSIEEMRRKAAQQVRLVLTGRSVTYLV